MFTDSFFIDWNNSFGHSKALTKFIQVFISENMSHFTLSQYFHFDVLKPREVSLQILSCGGRSLFRCIFIFTILIQSLFWLRVQIMCRLNGFLAKISTKKQVFQKKDNISFQSKLCEFLKNV